jgi:choline dehydrogenase
VRNGITPTEYHPSGTCAMLPRELGGVVDETLKVYDVGGLRIVDASVIPTLPGANTCQTVYAIAEKVGSWFNQH